MWVAESVAAIWAADSVVAIRAADSVVAIWAAALAASAAALQVSTLPGRAVTSITTGVSVTTGVSALVSGPAITVSMATGATNATPITIHTADICPRSEVCRHQQAPSQLRHVTNKPRIVLAGPALYRWRQQSKRTWPKRTWPRLTVKVLRLARPSPRSLFAAAASGRQLNSR